MTQQEWLAEVFHRLAINEGCRSSMYHDSKGIPTIGIGFNLQRGDAGEALQHCGVTNVDGVMDGSVALTPEQIQALFAYSFAPIEQEARASLVPGVFDALADARRFVICDLVFNLGNDGWLAFQNTRTLIGRAQTAKTAGDPVQAHLLFVQAAAALADSEWFTQVYDRAKRDCAMLRTGEWCDPNGNGNDVL